MRFLKILFLVLALAIFFVAASHTTIAQSTEEQLKQKEAQIKELEAKLTELRNQEKTLSLQVAVMNNQIKLTELRIESTKQLIAKLGEDILLLGGKIEKLEVRLKVVSEILLNRIVVSYKVGSIDPMQLIFTSRGFSDFISRTRYIQAAQEHDRKLLFELEQTKVNYNNQKDVLSTKQEEQKKLQAKLEGLNRDLAQQKKDKEALLEITRNDERRYQQLLEAALAEKSAIERAISLPLKDGQPIKQGETIAVIGNSGAPGCSSGPHLHLEFRKDVSPQNPADYLKSRDVVFDNSPDGSFSFSGSWEWPIENPRITQGYGMTHWARIGWYGGGPHTGIDMTSESSSLIKAPKDGTIYKGSTSCRGSTMNYVAIDHGGGLFTWYFHVK